MKSEIPVLILAGGQSTRMGIPKPLIKYDGQYWLEKQIEQLNLLGLERIHVVLGYHSELILNLVNIPIEDVTVVINQNPELGQFCSLQCGLRELKSESWVYVLPVDVPVPQKDVWVSLAERAVPGVEIIQPEWEGRGGHPLLLASMAIDEILKMAPNSRLDEFLKEKNNNVKTRVSVNDKIITLNLNTPEEFDNYVKTTL